MGVKFGFGFEVLTPYMSCFSRFQKPARSSCRIRGRFNIFWANLIVGKFLDLCLWFWLNEEYKSVKFELRTKLARVLEFCKFRRRWAANAVHFDAGNGGPDRNSSQRKRYFPSPFFRWLRVARAMTIVVSNRRTVAARHTTAGVRGWSTMMCGGVWAARIGLVI